MSTEGNDERNSDNKITILNPSYKVKSFKAIIPQVFACIIITLFNMVMGMSISYTGILVPELEKPDSDVHATKTETSWIVSSNALAIAVTSLPVGFLTDYVGRLKTLKISAIPGVTGWILIAVASNKTMIVSGRVLTGLTNVMALCACGIYISEVSWPKLRGTCLGMMCVTSSLGVGLVYLKGFIFHWRTIAWICAFYISLIFLLTFFIMESPVWLINNGRSSEARKALAWLNKYNCSEDDQELVDSHYNYLRRQHLNNSSKKIPKRAACCKKSLIKVVPIMLCLFLTQQFSGIYVIMANAVIFFNKIESNIDSLVASNIITGIPIIMSIINLFTFKKLPRKPLLIFSCLGAAICLITSAIFTKWIQEGTTNYKWVPVLALFIYMSVATMGLEPLPWSISAELYSLKLRGVSVGISFTIAGWVMFSAMQSYRVLEKGLNGTVGTQFFYAGVCLMGAILIYLFVPETHGKTLYEIEEFIE